MSINQKITLDTSQYIGQIRNVINGNDNMISSIKQVKSVLNTLRKDNYKYMINMQTTQANEQISKLQENINKIKKSVAITITAKNDAKTSLNRIKEETESMVKKNYSLEIKAVDKTKSVLVGIKNSIFNLKTLAAGIVFGAVGSKAFDLTIGNAMTNEMSLATLQTVLHDKKAGSEALKWSYKEAANTPFDAKEVVAGVSQLATSGLDFKKYLEPLGDAASAFNKPLEQAIFAMGKLKSGQLGMGVDMLRDFGVSNQDWQKQGVKFSKNGEMQGMTGDKASEMALKILKSKYGGLMNEHSNTAQGMISNIGDTINNMGRGLAGVDNNGNNIKGGLFDNFKKQLQVIQPLLNKIQDSKAFSQLQKDIGQLATAGGKKITEFLKGLQDPKKIKQYETDFKSLVQGIKDGTSITLAFGKSIVAVGGALKPLFSLIAAHPKIFANLFVGYEVTKSTRTIVSGIKNIKKELPSLITDAKTAGSSVANIFKTVGSGAVALGNMLKGKLLPLAKTIASGLINIIRPVFLFIEANPIVLVISAIVLACAGLYEAWKNNWGGCRDYIEKIIKDIEADWEAWKKEWTKLKEFFKDPIKATIQSVKEGTSVSTKRKSGAGPQGLAVDSGNALGTDYWQGGPTWVGEHGAEILNLPKGSQILNNRQSMNLMKAPTMHNNNQTNSKVNLSSVMNNPSKQFSTQATQWGKDIPNNLAKGITQNTKTVTKSVTEMANKIRELIHFTSPDKGPLADFDTYPIDMMKTFGDGIKNNTKLVTKPTTNMSSDVQGIYGDLTIKSGQNSTQAMAEFGKGIQDSTNNIVTITKTLTDKVINQFKTSFGIHSPSVVMYKMGNYLMQGLINGMTAKDLQGFIQSWLGNIMNGVGGNVQGWLTAALMLTGEPMSWLPGLEAIAMGESGGNPLSINLWDSNAAAGHPSKGLMQLIDENMSDWHLPGLDDIWNPIANAAAAIRLIAHQYGSPYNTPGIRSEMSGGAYKGYAVGLSRVPYDNFPAYLHEGEKILTRPEADNDRNNKVKIVIQKLADKIEVRNDKDIDTIIDKLYEVLSKTADNMA